MRRYVYLAALSLSIASFCASCDDDGEKGEFWGKTKFYTNFAFKPYVPDTMKQELRFDFNEDARRLLTNDIEFEVVERDNETADTIVARGIELYKNGERCADNVLAINPSERTAEVGIVFTAEASEGSHTLFLRERGTGGLDRIDYLELGKGLVVEKDDVYNPLAYWLVIGLIALVIVLALCFVLSRVMNPGTRFSKVFIDYNDGAGERTIRMGSAYKLVCSDKPVKNGVFSKFFVGVVRVEVNDFWTRQVTIRSGHGHKIRLSGLGDFQLDNDDTVRGEPFNVIDADGKKATITTT
ncbi:MAG: hypothetical protein LBN29_08080 [Mediterranea sp.]|jgi:hypothetical protein|nr:hypothetical protein [Mediterranea sp.]